LLHVSPQNRRPVNRSHELGAAPSVGSGTGNYSLCPAAAQ
jgi:hypothetical protein